MANIKLLDYFLLFFIYSFLGWIIETIACSFWAKKLVLNRGFLIGPYIPIYGTAAVLMTVFLREYQNDLFTLFCMSSVYASILEYFTSYWMEKVYHARWWDYTDHKFHLNGRICLENSLLFGLLGVVVILFVNPWIEKFLQLFIPYHFLLFLILGGVMLLDFLLTVVVMSKLNLQIKNVRYDATELISQETRKILSRYRIFYHHLFQAFPKFQYTKEERRDAFSIIHLKLEEMEAHRKVFKEKIKMKRLQIKNLKKMGNQRNQVKLIKEEMKALKKEK